MYNTGEIIPVYSCYHLKNGLLSVRMTVTKTDPIKTYTGLGNETGRFQNIKKNRHMNLLSIYWS